MSMPRNHYLFCNNFVTFLLSVEILETVKNFRLSYCDQERAFRAREAMGGVNIIKCN